jgi:hypothetical protein
MNAKVTQPAFINAKNVQVYGTPVDATGAPLSLAF